MTPSQGTLQRINTGIIINGYGYLSRQRIPADA